MFSHFFAWLRMLLTKNPPSNERTCGLGGSGTMYDGSDYALNIGT